MTDETQRVDEFPAPPAEQPSSDPPPNEGETVAEQLTTDESGMGGQGSGTDGEEPGVDQATAELATGEQQAADVTTGEPVPAAAALPFDVPQPPVWEPTDTDLDPNNDAGWDRAANHELVAVRPEDVPAILAVASAGILDPATARDVVSGKPVDDALAAQRGNDAAGPEASMVAADRASWSDVPGFASPLAGAGHRGVPATTPQRVRPQQPAAATELPAEPADSSAPDAELPAIPLDAESAAVPGSAPASNMIAFPQPAPEAALAPSERRWRRTSRRVRSGLESAARPVLLIALFVLGTSIGWTSYLATRPAPAPASQPAQVADSAATTKVPPQVQSLVAALNSGDQSQVQTVVPADAYRLLAGELASNNVQSIRAAKAQSTYSAGQDSATEILIAATTVDGQNFTFNLVVHLHNGVIAEFR